MFEITIIKAVIGTLIMVFALLEMWPRFQELAFPPRWLPLGGALSGFFGGLSGNQGALRSAFLLKIGLSKEAFVATGVVSAVIVDAARLVIYVPVSCRTTLLSRREYLRRSSWYALRVHRLVRRQAASYKRSRCAPCRSLVAMAMLLIGSGLVAVCSSPPQLAVHHCL